MQEETATVLDLLYTTDETLTADEIAAATDLSLDDIQQALHALEAQDYVSIGVKADHTHVHDIAITQRGVQAVEDDLPYADEYKQRFDPVPGYWESSGQA
jgi:transcription initiation factor IIE alpha subunit